MRRRWFFLWSLGLCPLISVFLWRSRVDFAVRAHGVVPVVLAFGGPSAVLSLAGAGATRMPRRTAVATAAASGILALLTLVGYVAWQVTQHGM